MDIVIRVVGVIVALAFWAWPTIQQHRQDDARQRAEISRHAEIARPTRTDKLTPEQIATVNREIDRLRQERKLPK